MSDRTSSDSELPNRRQSINSPTTTIVTSPLFEAYLSCPTKCFFLALDEPRSNHVYAAWTLERSRCYLNVGIRKLAARYDPKETARDALVVPSWASRKSGLAFNATARNQKLETVFHAIEWIAEKRESKSEVISVPVRFVANNKLSRTDKLLLAFDAHVFWPSS